MIDIEAKDLSKRFRKYKKKGIFTLKDLFVKGLTRKGHIEKESFWALKDINFSIEKGSSLGIIGSNGSGKSTLLKLILGILKPTSGRIYINGKVYGLIELGAGFHPELTGRENIYINGIILGFNKKEIAKKIDDILEFSGLGDFIDIPIKTYSSGMYLRLGFSIAGNIESDILLIDEILAVGDEEFQHKCLDRINEFKRLNKTIVFVSHDLGSIMKLCDHVIWLEKGVMKDIGDPKKIIDSYLSYVAEIENKGFSSKIKYEFMDGKPVRWGSKEIFITDVKFLDNRNNERYIYDMTDKMIIDIGYHTEDVIENPVFGIAIYRNDGILCFGSNTLLDNCNIEQIHGDGKVSIILKELSLLPGDYLLDIAIHSKDGYPYDYISHNSKRYRFGVRASNKSEGILNIKRDWVISSL